MIEEDHAQESTDPSVLAEQLMKLVLQEKLSPDVMQYQDNLVTQLKSAIKDQECRLEMYQQESDINSLDRNFKYSLYKLDIQRLNYLLKSYLRSRLFKIQKYSFYIVKNKEALQKLSMEEQEFVVGYSKLRYEMFDANVLKDLHKDLKGLDGLQVIFGGAASQIKKDTPSKQAQVNIQTPHKDSYRLFKILSNPDQLRYQIDISVLNLPENYREIISEGDIVFIPYSLGERLLLRGLVTLL